MRILRYTDSAYADEIRRLNRRAEASEHVCDVVASVIKDVRGKGDAALLELTKKFDGAELTAAGLRVTTAEMDAAWSGLDARVKEALEASRQNVQAFAHQS